MLGELLLLQVELLVLLLLLEGVLLFVVVEVWIHEALLVGSLLALPVFVMTQEQLGEGEGAGEASLVVHSAFGLRMDMGCMLYLFN